MTWEGWEEGGLGDVTSHTFPPPRKENKKKVVISTDFTIMCFFVFELLTEVEEELIRRIAIIFRRASFSFSSFPAFSFFLISKNISMYYPQIIHRYLLTIHDQFRDF